MDWNFLANRQASQSAYQNMQGCQATPSAKPIIQYLKDRRAGYVDWVTSSQAQIDSIDALLAILEGHPEVAKALEVLVR